MVQQKCVNCAKVDKKLLDWQTIYKITLSELKKLTVSISEVESDQFENLAQSKPETLEKCSTNFSSFPIFLNDLWAIFPEDQFIFCKYSRLGSWTQLLTHNTNHECGSVFSESRLVKIINGGTGRIDFAFGVALESWSVS